MKLLRSQSQNISRFVWAMAGAPNSGSNTNRSTDEQIYSVADQMQVELKEATSRLGLTVTQGLDLLKTQIEDDLKVTTVTSPLRLKKDPTQNDKYFSIPKGNMVKFAPSSEVMITNDKSGQVLTDADLDNTPDDECHFWFKVIGVDPATGNTQEGWCSAEYLVQGTDLDIDAAIAAAAPVTPSVTPVVTPVVPVVPVAPVTPITPALTPVTVLTLTPTALATMPPATVAALPPAVFKLIPPAAIGGFPIAAAPLLPPTLTAVLTPAMFAAMPPRAIAKLTPAAFAAIPPATIAALPLAAAPLLPAILTGALTPAAVAALPPATVAAMNPAARAALPAPAAVTPGAPTVVAPAAPTSHPVAHKGPALSPLPPLLPETAETAETHKELMKRLEDFKNSPLYTAALAAVVPQGAPQPVSQGMAIVNPGFTPPLVHKVIDLEAKIDALTVTPPPTPLDVYKQTYSAERELDRLEAMQEINEADPDKVGEAVAATQENLVLGPIINVYRARKKEEAARAEGEAALKAHTEAVTAWRKASEHEVYLKDTDTIVNTILSPGGVPAPIDASISQTEWDELKTQVGKLRSIKAQFSGPAYDLLRQPIPPSGKKELRLVREFIVDQVSKFHNDNHKQITKAVVEADSARDEAQKELNAANDKLKLATDALAFLRTLTTTRGSIDYINLITIAEGRITTQVADINTSITDQTKIIADQAPIINKTLTPPPTKTQVDEAIAKRDAALKERTRLRDQRQALEAQGPKLREELAQIKKVFAVAEVILKANFDLVPEPGKENAPFYLKSNKLAIKFSDDYADTKVWKKSESTTAGFDKADVGVMLNILNKLWVESH